MTEPVGTTTLLPEPRAYRPRLRGDLEITDGGPELDHVVVFDPERSKYFRIKRPEFETLRGLDSDRPASADEQLIARAAGLQLLEGTQVPAAAAPPRPRFSLAFTRLVEVDPSSILDRVRRPIQAVPTAAMWFGALAVMTSGAVAMARLGQRPHLTAGLWFAVSSALTLAYILHELGHAAAVVRYGGKVRRIGIALMYFRPICFCDVSGAWEFPRRTQRVAVSFAGILTNLLLAGVAWSALWVGALPTNVRHFAVLFGVANVVLGVLNLFPFIKMDGYWMLASALDKPNLRAHAIEDTRAWAEHVFLRRPRTTRRGVASVMFGLGCIAAVPLILGLVFMQLWGWSSHFGLAGHVVCVALMLYLVGSSIPAVRSRFSRTAPA
jgi:putative peptide zinc metalloprotease protein